MTARLWPGVAWAVQGLAWALGPASSAAAFAPDLDPGLYAVGPIPAPAPGDGMPGALTARSMPPHGATSCMTGEICQGGHDLTREHIWTSPPHDRTYPWEMP